VLGLLAKADPKEGASVFKMCAACHGDEKDGPHKVGNNLWNIVGSPKAARPDYRYSQALGARGGTWSYRELAEYLYNPRTSVPGTSMAFAGIRDNQRMANLLAYMRTRADKPMPLPR
jgi:cytochrome c